MTIFFFLLSALAVLAVVAGIRMVARDGYRRQPTRPLATGYLHSSEPAGTSASATEHPSDMVANQWLSSTAPATGEPTHPPQRVAGAMILRPW